MKQDVICPVCNQIVGYVHGNIAAEWLSNHILASHKDVYSDIAIVNAAIERIREQYKVYARDIHFYNLRYLK